MNRDEVRGQGYPATRIELFRSVLRPRTRYGQELKRLRGRVPRPSS